MKETYDIIETANNAGNFQVFTRALVDAGLKDALKGEGPYTIFAPTDQAFAKMPKTKLDALLKPENKETIHLLLRNHIVLGKLTTSELKRVDNARTANGEELKFESRDGLWVNEAKILFTDLKASNGVLHGIDTVLMPQMKAAPA